MAATNNDMFLSTIVVTTDRLLLTVLVYENWKDKKCALLCCLVEKGPIELTTANIIVGTGYNLFSHDRKIHFLLEYVDLLISAGLRLFDEAPFLFRELFVHYFFSSSLLCLWNMGSRIMSS